MRKVKRTEAGKIRRRGDNQLRLRVNWEKMGEGRIM